MSVEFVDAPYLVVTALFLDTFMINTRLFLVLQSEFY